MHILFAHNDYAKFSGEERAVELMAKLLKSEKQTVSWIRPSSNIIDGSASNRIKAFFSGIYSIKAKKQITKIIFENKIDLVQVQNLYPFLSPSILLPCKQKGVPIVMRCPNYRLFCPNGLHFTHGAICERCLSGKEWNCILYNCERNIAKSIGYALRNATARITGMIVNNVDIFVVLSKFQKKRFIEGGISPGKIAILPNTVKIKSEQDSNRLPGDYILFIGRVSPEKGINMLIDAAKNLPQIQFYVVGRTNAMPDIENHAPRNLKFLGFKAGNELENLLENCRLLVFPSRWFEGFPNVILEAMAKGKPVVASRIGSLPDIVDDDATGFLYEPGSVEDLTEKIQYLWGKPTLCQEMGLAGREKCKIEYSDEKYIERLMKIYQKAVR